MKVTFLAAILLPALVLLSACDRHSWEPTETDTGTKMLYEKKKSHEKGHKGDHDKDHADGGDH